MSSNYDYLAKIIIIGDSSVGKSCLLIRMADRQWFSENELTIGVDFRAMTLKPDKCKYKFKVQLWDTSGQERFKSIVRSYYREGTGCFLVFDITNHMSFVNLNEWYTDLKKGNPNINDKCILLIGTKSDLKKDRVIEIDQAKKFSEEHGLLGYIETSAKSGTGMDSTIRTMLESFEKLIDSGDLCLERNVSRFEEMDVEPSGGGLFNCCLCQ